jgi:hypothetical protein
MRRWGLAIALFGAAIGSASAASAQVHWDVGLQGGATERLTIGGGQPTPTPGPSGEIHSHVAVLPMLRVGPYVAFDLSPAPGRSARQTYAAGLRAKVTPPWLSAPWRVWAFLGVGFADAVTPRYRAKTATSTGPIDTPVEGFSTEMIELPVGIGVGHKLRGPWEIYAELAGRIVVLRSKEGPASSGGGSPVAPLPGDDLLAVSLSVGVSLGQ